ncbi:MAG: hypothetical protein LAO20_14675 [Acidobacteriia bacterium]|nr:hypothetical protein [Terriglobia bacterium]
MAFSRCPRCDHQVSTPVTYDWSAWSKLACPNCKARLERTRSRASWLILPLVLSSTTFGFLAGWLRPLPFMAGVFFGLLIAGYVGAIILLIWDWRRPRLLVRKKLPQPEIRLNLDLKGQDKIRKIR